MNSEIAQLIALALHFNARARELAIARFFPDNSTCNFCESIRFEISRRHWLGLKKKWSVAFNSPDEWLTAESPRDHSAYLLHIPVNPPNFPDRMSVGFVGGGGRWILAVAQYGQMDCWEPAWGIGDRDALDRRIWRVYYSRIAHNVPRQSPACRPLNRVTSALASTLAAIEDFARARNLDHFAECFANGQKSLAADSPLEQLPYYKDMAPPGLLSLEANRVLACCQAAWVFGGMGSWNDMAYEGEEGITYNKLSDALFNLIYEGICAATYSSTTL